MVERIKEAISKARAARESAMGGFGVGTEAAPRRTGPGASAMPGTGTMSVSGGAAGTMAEGAVASDAGLAVQQGATPLPVDAQPGALWDGLAELEIDADVLEAQRVVAHAKTDPAHVPIDILRTKLLKEMHNNGWKRLAITSPTAACGKTFVATNLAFSLARQQTLRTLLIDFDLKKPQLASYVGCAKRKSLERLLTGAEPVADYFLRTGTNLALGLNAYPIVNSSELIQDDKTRAVLSGAINALDPDVVILDLPPVLTTDDVLAFVSNADCVLLVAAAGATTAEEIEECEHQLSKLTNFVGVVLNKCDVVSNQYYDYGRSA